MKIKTTFGAILLIMSLITFYPLQTGAAITGKNAETFSRLEQIASEKGKVRIIIKFEVPDIDALTTLSTNFKTGIIRPGYQQEAANSDYALEESISRASNGLLLQLNNYPYVITRSYSTLPYVGMIVPLDTLEHLKCIPEIVQIVEDEAIPVGSWNKPPNDKNSDDNNIYEPKLTQSIPLIGADLAWQYGYTGNDWYVAILDTGILTTHNMFKGKNIIEQCFAWGEDFNNTVNGDCPNKQKEMTGTGAAAHYKPQFYHGSHVAGIATGNDGISKVYGVARDADIIAVNVFSFFSDDNNVYSWVSDQLKGLEFVYLQRNNYKIAAVNMSLGGGRYSDFCDNNTHKPVIDNLRAAGIATVISSGNEGYCGSVSAPACISSAVAVAGIDKNLKAYEFGNWDNEMVSLLAPAVGISSAVGNSDTGYISMTGTSMAAPHVAGAWAIMKQFNQSFSVDSILNTFKTTGNPTLKASCSGYDSEPLLRLDNALESLFIIAPPRNVSVNQQLNRSLLQTEYINFITWENSPFNSGKNISQYNIYIVKDSGNTLLINVNSDVFSYMHRHVEGNIETRYAVSCVDANGNESPLSYYTLKFTE